MIHNHRRHHRCSTFSTLSGSATLALHATRPFQIFSHYDLSFTSSMLLACLNWLWHSLSLSFYFLRLVDSYLLAGYNIQCIIIHSCLNLCIKRHSYSLKFSTIENIVCKTCPILCYEDNPLNYTDTSYINISLLMQYLFKILQCFLECSSLKDVVISLSSWHLLF